MAVYSGGGRVSNLSLASTDEECGVAFLAAFQIGPPYLLPLPMAGLLEKWGMGRKLGHTCYNTMMRRPDGGTGGDGGLD